MVDHVRIIRLSPIMKKASQVLPNSFAQLVGAVSEMPPDNPVSLTRPRNEKSLFITQVISGFAESGIKARLMAERRFASGVEGTAGCPASSRARSR
jgi:hypothetical protein